MQGKIGVELSRQSQVKPLNTYASAPESESRKIVEKRPCNDGKLEFRSWFVIFLNLKNNVQSTVLRYETMHKHIA